jgi:hypothetical protein
LVNVTLWRTVFSDGNRLPSGVPGCAVGEKNAGAAPFPGQVAAHSRGIRGAPASLRHSVY